MYDLDLEIERKSLLIFKEGVIDMIEKEIYAMFLPQFHRIPENDIWWGEGFTEWDNVKKARPLFINHKQPQIPLDGYYDLSEVSTLSKQSALAREYGLSGFCFYHYYSRGKKLLEKPAENLLNNNSIDIQFFFSWANHDWRRTWYQYNNELLFEQKYGNEEEIRDHYKYLSPFFVDKRYKKINNKPLFLIYRSDLIDDFQLMKRVWDECARKDGFDGVYFVSTITGSGIDKRAGLYDAYYSFEPDAIIPTRGNLFERKYTNIRARIVPIINEKLDTHFLRLKYDYKKLSIKASRPIKKIDKPYIQGAFARWDNSPRHSYNSRIIFGSCKTLFKEMLCRKLINNDTKAMPIIIVNSWNEWSEGSNIEPNTYDQFCYLEAIKESLNE